MPPILVESPFEPWFPAFGCDAYAQEVGPIPLDDDARRDELRRLGHRMVEIVKGHILPDGTCLADTEYPEDYYPSRQSIAHEWDLFWSAQMYDSCWPDGEVRLRTGGMMWYRDRPWMTDVLRRFREAGVKRVLCAGCGPDQEPRVLACAGMAATALDFSQIGLRLGRVYPFTRDSFERFLDTDHAERYLQPGGSVAFAVGDLRSSEVCQGPFDAVLTHCTLQTLGDAPWDALDALLARLAPGGLFVGSFHNARRSAEPYSQRLGERGFSVLRAGERGPRNGWTAALFFSSG